MFSSALRTASRVTSLSRPTTLVKATAVLMNPAASDTQVRCRSNRSRRGMYDGKDIRSGNNVSFSERKTRRKFKPNVVVKRVYSEVLDEMIRFHLTTSTLRSMDKVGGLDNYLLTSKHVTQGEGLMVKKRILERLEELDAESTA
jgi:large subunit ribosomal protein L28